MYTKKIYIHFLSRAAAIRTLMKRRYFGAFRLAVLDGRQPARVRRAANPSNYHPFRVRRSFVETVSGPGKTAGNPLWIAEDFNAAQAPSGKTGF